MILKQCFTLKVHDGDQQIIDYAIGENSNGQIAIRVGSVEITEEDLLKMFGRTQVTLWKFVDTISDLPAEADAGQIVIVKYDSSTPPAEVNCPYMYTEEKGWLSFGSGGSGETYSYVETATGSYTPVGTVSATTTTQQFCLDGMIASYADEVLTLTTATKAAAVTAVTPTFTGTPATITVRPATT